eukprot:g32058.t1
MSFLRYNIPIINVTRQKAKQHQKGLCVHIVVTETHVSINFQFVKNHQTLLPVKQGEVPPCSRSCPRCWLPSPLSLLLMLMLLPLCAVLSLPLSAPVVAATLRCSRCRCYSALLHAAGPFRCLAVAAATLPCSLLLCAAITAAISATLLILSTVLSLLPLCAVLLSLMPLCAVLLSPLARLAATLRCPAVGHSRRCSLSAALLSSLLL